MIMKKRRKSSPSPLSRATLVAYISCMLIIFIPLFYMLICLQKDLPLSGLQLKYYASVLEHILAGIAFLTAGCYLIERIVRGTRKE